MVPDGEVMKIASAPAVAHRVQRLANVADEVDGIAVRRASGCPSACTAAQATVFRPVAIGDLDQDVGPRPPYAALPVGFSMRGQREL